MGAVLAALSGGTGRCEKFSFRGFSLRGGSFSPLEGCQHNLVTFLGGGDEAAEREASITLTTASWVGSIIVSESEF